MQQRVTVTVTAKAEPGAGLCPPAQHSRIPQELLVSHRPGHRLDENGGGGFSPRASGSYAREQGVTASEADRRRAARHLTHSHPERYVPREAPTQPARAGATEVLTGTEARGLAHRHTNNQEGPRLPQTPDTHTYTHIQTDPQTQLPSKTHGHRPHACRHPETPQSICPPGRKPLAGLMW